MQNKKLKIFIVAGEVSGDVLGAKIMREFKNVEFIGIGGENMQKAGLASIFSISDLAVMGIFEVIGKSNILLKRIKQTVDVIKQEKPDLVLSIDSPSFIKRVIKQVKKSNKKRNEKSPKFYHVVAPQVWAWGSGRAEKFAQIFDRLYSFFDFEVPYFTKYGLDTIAVGHPIAEGLSQYLDNKKTKQPTKIITLVPGSRMSEVKKLMPVFKETVEILASRNEKYKFIIPTVETTKDYVKSEIKGWAIKPVLIPSQKRYEVYADTYIAIIASGTVSAEFAIMHVPAIVIYKMNKFTQFLAKRLVKIKWASLINILLNRDVYKELLGDDATAENIILEFDRLSDEKNRKLMISELENADDMWHRTDFASKLIAEDILNRI